MKNILTKLIALILVVCSIFTLTACGDGHNHDFSAKKVEDAYIATASTCDAPAKYYYACTGCEEKSDKTYEIGSASHDYVNHVCSRCGDEEVYTQGLVYTTTGAGEVVINGIEEGVTADPIIIPTKIENKPVTKIGMNAFKGSTFKNIILPEGLKEILSYAFQDSQLGAVTIPTTVVHIHPQAFDTDSLKNVTFLVTDGWYVSRHYKAAPAEDDARSVSAMANATETASAITNCSRGTSAGYSHWYRIEK